MKSLVDYTIIVRPDDNNTYVAYIPAIEGCHAWGKTEQKARLELNNVFDMILEEYIEQNKVLPDDVEIKVVAHA